MKREDVETLLWIGMIIILVLLTLKIDAEEDNYSCDKCIVNLSSKMAGMDQPLGKSEVVIPVLFEEFKEEGCVITWSPTQGYING